MSRVRESLKQWLFVGALLCAAFVLGLELRSLVDRHNLWPGGEAASAVLPPAVDGDFARTQADPRRFVTTDEEVLRRPMEFHLEFSGELRAVGSIDQGTAERLATALDRHEDIRTVSFNSPGGTLDDAMAMARLMRERGLTAKVEDGAICASSCPLALAGGEERRIGARAAVGVHQFYSPAKGGTNPAQATADAQRTAARIVRHLDRMGVDPALWLHALETPPRALYYLSGPELRRYRLVTEPQMS